MTSPWYIENKYTTLWVISSYIEKQCNMIWRHGNLCGFIYKWLLLRKVPQSWKKYSQLDNKTIIELGPRRYEELLKPRFVFSNNTNLCLNNSSYLALPHSIIVYYYTTFLKGVQITRKTSTNIQRYSDSRLFIHFRFDEYIFLANQIASARLYFMHAYWVISISKFLYRIPFAKAVV